MATPRKKATPAKAKTPGRTPSKTEELFPIGSVVKSAKVSKKAVVTRHSSSWIYVQPFDAKGKPEEDEDGDAVEVAERRTNLTLWDEAPTQLFASPASPKVKAKSPKASPKSTKKNSPGKKAPEGKSAFKSVLGAYKSQLARRPRTVNLLQSCLVTCASVLTSNIIQGKPFDYMECAAAMIVSFTLITPVLMVFYSFLNNLQFSVGPSMLIDQGFFAPWLNFAITVYRQIILALLTGAPVTPLAFASASLDTMMPIVLRGWLFWVPVRLLMMKFVPVMYHIALNSVAAFFWNIIFQLALHPTAPAAPVITKQAPPPPVYSASPAAE